MSNIFRWGVCALKLIPRNKKSIHIMHHNQHNTDQIKSNLVKNYPYNGLFSMATSSQAELHTDRRQMIVVTLLISFTLILANFIQSIPSNNNYHLDVSPSSLKVFLIF